MTFVTSLSEKDAKKALEELNENPETRDEKIQGNFSIGNETLAQRNTCVIDICVK